MKNSPTPYRHKLVRSFAPEEIMAHEETTENVPLRIKVGYLILVVMAICYAFLAGYFATVADYMTNKGNTAIVCVVLFGGLSLLSCYALFILIKNFLVNRK